MKSNHWLQRTAEPWCWNHEMKEMLVEWVRPLLWCLALLAAGGFGLIYAVKICPGVKRHTFVTKLLCPHFILD